jgi:AcrR family transcriptional regulator
VDRTGRAAGLPAEARRAAIVAATIPLLSTWGTSVTTRQIAEASGVAEGTIFRVFADKDAVIDAAVEAALDTGPLEAALAAIDTALPLEARLERAVELLQARITEIWQLLSMVGRTAPSDRRTRQIDLPALVALLEPDRPRLRFEPAVAARLLRGLVMATSHPALVSTPPLTPATIVELFLDGARVPASTTPRRQPVASRA